MGIGPQQEKTMNKDKGTINPQAKVPSTTHKPSSASTSGVQDGRSTVGDRNQSAK